MEGERKARSEWRREHEPTHGHVKQDVVHEVQSALVHAPTRAARADGSGVAAECDDVVLAAPDSLEVREAPTQNPAVEVLVQFFRRELR